MSEKQTSRTPHLDYCDPAVALRFAALAQRNGTWEEFAASRMFEDCDESYKRRMFDLFQRDLAAFIIKIDGGNIRDFGEWVVARQQPKPIVEPKTEPKHVYTIVTPEGVEIVLGAYASGAGAERACKQLFAADWYSLSSGPLQQRAVLPGEKVKRGVRWTADHEHLPVAGELKTTVG